jgi:hypothetical protein
MALIRTIFHMGVRALSELHGAFPPEFDNTVCRSLYLLTHPSFPTYEMLPFSFPVNNSARMQWQGHMHRFGGARHNLGIL